MTVNAARLSRRATHRASRLRMLQAWAVVALAGFACLWSAPLFREKQLGWFVGDRDIPGRTVSYRNGEGGCWRVVRHDEDLVVSARVGQSCRETASGTRFVVDPTGAPNGWATRVADQFFGRWWRGW